jgi:hypothetical protein
VKRKIIAFLAGPIDDKKRDDKKFDIYTSPKNGQTYAVVIVEGFYDEKSETIYESDACSVWGDEDFLNNVLKIGRKLHVSS